MLDECYTMLNHPAAYTSRLPFSLLALPFSLLALLLSARLALLSARLALLSARLALLSARLALLSATLPFQLIAAWLGVLNIAAHIAFYSIA
jgi:hypothetical protein